MPYCTQCGNEVGPADRYCGRCGEQQAGGEPGRTPPGAAGFAPSGSAKRANDFLGRLDDHRASVFCYIPWVGWVMAIIVLATERFRDNRDVRFHAFQGLYLFVLWLFVDWVFSPMMGYADATRVIGKVFKLGVLVAWIFMIVKTSQHQMFRLPVLGELADRSVSEQK